MKVLVLLLLLIALPTGLLNAQEGPVSRRIIDVHLHAYPPDVFGAVRIPDPATGQPSPLTEREIRDQTLVQMRDNGVVLGIISGPPDIVERWKQAAPNVFIGAPQFPHPFPFPDLDRLRDLHSNGTIGALGEVTTQFEGLAPDDEQLEPYLELAEELGIPIGIHMSTGPKATPDGSGRSWAPNFRVALGNPLADTANFLDLDRMQSFVVDEVDVV